MTTSPPTDPVSQEVERNFRHNFIFNSLDGASFWFGYSFFSPATILPLFISRLTDNPLIIGLIPFFSTSFFLIPQLFTSNWVSRKPIKKFFPVTLGFFLERVPLFAMPLVTYFLTKQNPGLTVLLMILLYAWHTIGAGIIIVGWQDMIAKIIPVDRRGRFFGITNFGGTISGVLGAIAVTWVLGWAEFPNGFALSFAAGSLLIFLSWIFISQTREPAVHSSKPHVSDLEFLRSLPAIIRKDKNFARFLVAQSVIATGAMAAGFLIVYATQRWKLPDSEAGSFTIALLIGQALSNLVFGILADRKGHKLNLEIGTLCAVLSFGLALAAPSAIWFFAIFFLRGITAAVAQSSNISISFEFCAPEDRPTYIGLANTIPGIAAGIAPLFGGWLATVSGYPLLFIFSTIISIAGLIVLRFLVREPRFARAQPASTPVQNTTEGVINP